LAEGQLGGRVLGLDGAARRKFWLQAGHAGAKKNKNFAKKGAKKKAKTGSVKGRGRRGPSAAGPATSEGGNWDPGNYDLKVSTCLAFVPPGKNWVAARMRVGGPR